MTVAFNVSSNDKEYLGSVSGFNVWDYTLLDEEISNLAFGCGEEDGNIFAWSHLDFNGEIIIGSVGVQNATCKDRGGATAFSPFDFFAC